MNRKLSGPESRTGFFCRRKNSLLLKGFEPRPVLPAGSHYTECVIRIDVKKSSILLMWDNPLMSALLWWMTSLSWSSLPKRWIMGNGRWPSSCREFFHPNVPLIRRHGGAKQALKQARSMASHRNIRFFVLYCSRVSIFDSMIETDSEIQRYIFYDKRHDALNQTTNK